MNYINADRSVLYKEQGRGAAANKYAALSEAHGRAAIEADIAEYNEIENGKWTGIIDPFVTKGALNASWNIPIAAAVSETVSELPYTEMGIAVEDQQDINAAAELEFSGYTKDIRFIDIFNRGTGSFDWKVSADADWIVFNKDSGTIRDDDRIYAGIDWSSAPAGVNEANVTVTRYIGENAVQTEEIKVTLNNNIEQLPEKTYAEANGYVSIEAEHYTNSVTKAAEGEDGICGVVTGAQPRLITDVSGGVGMIAIYGPDGALSSLQISDGYSDGAYTFENAAEPVSGDTVKGMVWSSLEKMEPMSNVYGLASERTDVVYEWQEQDDLGRSGTSMKFMPNTAERISDNSAYLEYDVYFESAGTFNVDVYRIPTLNERGSVNFGIGIDEDEPTVLEGYNRYYNNSDGTDRWGSSILNNNETLTAAVTADEPGIHTIRLYGIDPGAVIDKLVITTGEKHDSYYGAPESYNTTYNNAVPEMPEASEASTELTGEVTALFEPKLYISGADIEDGAVTGIDIIKLADTADAQITAAAYDSDGVMLDCMTVTGEVSQAGVNEKVTVPISFDIPENAAELQVMAYDGAGTLNALSPSYTAELNSVSLMASYDGGVTELRSDLGQYIGREALCLMTDDADGSIVYIRQETVKDGTFKTIRSGELDGAYSINIGVAGDGIVISEKAYTAVNIETDNPEESETLYSWDFSDESQTAESVNNIPVLGGNAAYDADTGSIEMTSTNSSGGAMSVTFDEPVKFVQGDKITVVSKVAYGRQSGKYMDWSVTDSAGNELLSTHITAYSSTSDQSVKIGGEEKLGSGLPAGIVTSNKNNNGYENGFTTYTAVFDPDIDTITLTASNDEGSTTFTGKFPEGTVYDIAELKFSTTQTYASRSCYVDDISVTRTTAPSYTMGFDVRNDANAVIENAAVTVTDAVYGTVIAPESDGTYHLCDGVYSYAVTAEGYEPLTGELELSQATLSKTVTVRLQRIGEPDPTPEAPDGGSTISVTG